MTETGPQAFLSLLAGAGQALPPESLALLERYAQALLAWNRKVNLIGPRAEKNLWEEHLLEAALLSPRLGSADPLADLGSGAGLPGLVLAILEPRREVHLFEARAKKASFLALVAAELGLSRVKVWPVRVPETARPDLAGRFPLVVSRAAAPLARLLGPAGWLCAPAGELVAVKGPAAAQELAQVQANLAPLGWRLLGLEALPGPAKKVVLLRLQKIVSSD